VNSLELLQSVHGYLAALSTAALIHPALLLRRGKPLSRRNVWAVAGAAVTTSATFALGIALYGDYRSGVKRQLFAASVRAGLAFETKEHLAFLVLCLALGATFAALSAPAARADLRRAAALLFALAAMTCLVIVGLGAWVAAVRDFGDLSAKV